MELRADPSVHVESARVPSRSAIRALLVAIGLLNVANAACIVAGANTDGTKYWLLALERNPSTWLSTALLALAGVAAWAAGRGRPDAARWNIVAVIFGVLSLDEVATIHERLAAVP